MSTLRHAFSEILKSGFIRKDVIKRHLEYRKSADQILPDSDSFFFVLEIPTQKYHFIGKQHESVTGYKNEEFLKGGVELFLKRLHPEDIDCILNSVYRDFFNFVTHAEAEDKRNLLFRYNYRFRRKDGEYIHLMELINILEVDGNGLPALVLGNVILIDTDQLLPIRVVGKKLHRDGLSETIFSKTYPVRNATLHEITKRELDIVQGLAMGKTSKEIAVDLFISRHTVNTHRRNLMKKLGCKSAVDLVRFAFHNALLGWVAYLPLAMDVL